MRAIVYSVENSGITRRTRPYLNLAFFPAGFFVSRAFDSNRKAVYEAKGIIAID